ncbi:MAG: hypothetical protein H0W15_08755 [Gemmatimonadales bacterium]|nr:hypothetical protein [Gemmatimonadales bacterium]
MTNLPPTKKVDRDQATRYLQSGRTFLAAAKALEALAEEDESYGSAIALLAVHAVISHGDALVIAYSGNKSKSGEHRDTVRLLRHALGNRLPDQQEKEMLAVLGAKDAVAYQGKYFPLNEAQAVLAKAAAFGAWAEPRYQERPG